MGVRRKRISKSNRHQNHGGGNVGRAIQTALELVYMCPERENKNHISCSRDGDVEVETSKRRREVGR